MVKETKYLDNCKQSSFYKCLVPLIRQSTFSRCPKKCLKESFKVIGSANLTEIPTCQNEAEADCSESHVYEDILGKASSGLCPKSCTIHEYSGEINYRESKTEAKEENNTFSASFRFAAPFTMTSYQEYLIYDFNGLVGSVGGTLGIFIGFNFYETIARVIDRIKNVTANRSQIN